MSQCSAAPIRMASSTACSLRTGSEPGSPRQMGQMFTLGSSPNALRQPQNSLVAVASSQCTSSPTTSSQSASRPRPLRSVGLDDGATRNRTASPSAGASTCTPTGRPPAPVPNGTETAGCPDRLDGMVHTSFMYIAMGSSTLAPRSNAVVGAVAPSNTSTDSYARSNARITSVRTRWAWA